MSNLDVAIVTVAFYVGMFAVAYCFFRVYDWWYARRKRRRARV